MTSFSRPEPPLHKGALVQLIKDVVGVVTPNAVVFQYNPQKLSHTITPWNPQEVDQTQRGAQMPTVQPFSPKESFSLSLELDATDELEVGNPTAIASGVAPRLAALKKLTWPSRGLFGDLVGKASAQAGGATCNVERATVPIVLFVWSPNRILPVRVSSFSVEETLYSPTLVPLHATVSLGLEVMTPDSFKCQTDEVQKLAIAAYDHTKMLDDALAIASVAQTGNRATGIVPFI